MSLDVGTRLGRYEIRSQLGAGGMGEVYLAEDTKLDRKVALKLLPADVAANQDRMRRFVQEAKAASTLNHPNIITIHEIDESDSINFIATEFIDGETLRERLRNAPMKLGEVLDVAAQIASALAAAHAVGIVHRDVKPENVMLRRDGIAKVLDFGLAKLTERAPSNLVDTEAPTRAAIKTEPGVVMGTALYMSPEQARGLQVDARTDVFSFGVVLYEMVTGRLPFEGSTSSDTVALILSEKEPPPLARYSRDVPFELERIVSKALQKNRDQRYQTIKDLRLDLQSLKQELEFEKKLERSVPPKGEGEAKTAEPAEATTVVESLARPTIGERRLVSALLNRRNIVVAILSVAVLTTGAYLYSTHTRRGAINSLAVVPFSNVNADLDTEYLSDGITDSIIDRLSQLPNLTVMSHSAVFHYKGRETDARAIGRELGVEAVLTGRVVKRGDALTINLELVDARDNSHIWGEQYDHKLADILALQREIPVDVSDKLRLRLSGESKARLAKQYTDNAEAYQFYLKGRLSWEKWTLDGTKEAIAYFQEAIKRDPNYALAYSGLADAYTIAPYGTGLTSIEAHRRARDAANRALELDQTLGEPHAALAEVLLYEEWDFAGAEREFKKAIELSPSYAEGHHMYSHFLLAMGRINESLVESRKFFDLDPLSPAPNLHLGYQYLHARQYDLSVQQHLKTLEMDPNSARAHNQLGDTYYQKGMFDQAVAEYLTEAVLSGTPQDDITALKNAYAASGIKGYLNKRTEQFLAIRARQGQGWSVAIAAEYSRLGDKDQAFAWLEKAYAEHVGSLVHLREELAFDNVRSDPRFADLLRRIGLPPP